ncbi:Uridine phosphorylase, partial [Globisporangium splendens]
MVSALVHVASPVHTQSTDPLHHVANSHIREMDSDVLYHIGLTCSSDEKQKIVDLFGDVRFFITGGSAERMTHFAQSVASELKIATPFGYALTPIGSTSRYTVYKVGPVLIANHGMGMPSVSILLHEVTKLLEYAGANDTIYIRMGTSGGIGVDPGTVVITSEGVNNKMESVDDVAILGDIVQRPSICTSDVIADITAAATEVGLPFAVGKTLTCDDFYEGQGRLDGAICEYSLEDKMQFLQKCADSGVKNIEMEARGFAAFCYKLHIPVAVVCVTLLNRLLGDQVLSSHATLQGYEERPAAVLLHYIKKKLAM